MSDYHIDFLTKYPQDRFINEDIARICHAWWYSTPMGRRQPVWSKKLQGAIHQILSDYTPDLIVKAIKNFSTCLQSPNDYYYGNARYGLERFLKGYTSQGERILDFFLVNEPEDLRINKQQGERHIDYKIYEEQVTKA